MRLMFGLFMGCLLCASSSPVHAQFKTLEVLARQIREQTKTDVFYKPSLGNSRLGDSLKIGASMTDFSTLLARELGLRTYYDPIQRHFYIVERKFEGNEVLSALTGQRPDDVSQPRYDSMEVTGIVLDGKTEKPVIAVISDASGSLLTRTDVKGGFNVKIPAGSASLNASAPGMIAVSTNLHPVRNQVVNFMLFESVTELQEVVVNAESSGSLLSSVVVGGIRLDAGTFKKIPQLMGEADVIRSLSLMPGVSTVGEGSGGFNVRGASSDQNLVLLDGVPIFNTSHLFGFFSIFNSDALRDFSFYRSDIPASFGGRSSSVLSVRLRDGNKDKIHVTGGVGVVASRLMVDGPIGKKLTYSFGGRFGYPNWILKKIPDIDVRQSEASFYDLNAKLKYRLNNQNSLSFTIYRGKDDFVVASDTTYIWSSQLASCEWQFNPSEKWSSSISLFYSGFESEVLGSFPKKEFDFATKINSLGVKADVSYFNQRGRIDFGFIGQRLLNGMGVLNPVNESSLVELTIPEESAIETGTYVSFDGRLFGRFSIRAGLRYSGFSTFGPGKVFLFAEDVPRSASTVIDTAAYEPQQKISFFHGFEPRISLVLRISDSAALRVSYDRNLQFMQQISNSAAVTPVDVWKFSNQYFGPLVSNQFSISYSGFLARGGFEYTIEAYYKTLDGIVDYKDGARLFLNPVLDAELLAGTGKNYGFEAMVSRRNARVTGWVSYVYSRSLRRVESIFETESINGGNYFPSNFDRPHDFTLVLNYQISKRVQFSTNFKFLTGRPITFPVSSYTIDGYSFVHFSERNQFRTEPYHRLDLALTVLGSLKKNKRYRSSWSLSVYNAYGRENPFSVFFKPQFQGRVTQAYRLAVVGTIVPSITYNFEF